MIIRIIIALSILTLGFKVEADEESIGKYKDFELSVIYPQGHHNMQSPKSLNEDVLSMFSVLKNYYALSSLKAFGDFYAYAKLTDNRFLAIVKVYPQSGRGEDAYKESARITNCNYPEELPEDAEIGKFGIPKGDCDYLLHALIDTESGTVKRLDQPSTDFFSPYFDSRSANDIYGCYVEKPLLGADLNLDKLPELILFSGDIHKIWEDRGNYDAQGSLDIKFLSSDGNRKLFSTEFVMLSYNTYDGSDKYQSSRDKLGKRITVDGVRKFSEPQDLKPALRSYSKLYFKDFDEDDRLDVLVWRRHYESRLKTDPIKGYKLVKEEFEHFEESEAAFVKHEITNEQGNALLKKYDLTWKQGFPNSSLCKTKEDKSQLISDDGKETQAINDPVLEK